MRSLPGSLDGSRGEVRDESGRRVASFMIDDERQKAADPVYVVFEARDLAWEDRLVAGAGRGLRVSLAWPDGRNLDHVIVKKPYVPPVRSLLTTGFDDPDLGFESAEFAIPLSGENEPSSLDVVLFAIDHPDL